MLKGTKFFSAKVELKNKHNLSVKLKIFIEIMKTTIKLAFFFFASTLWISCEKGSTPEDQSVFSRKDMFDIFILLNQSLKTDIDTTGLSKAYSNFDKADSDSLETKVRFGAQTLTVSEGQFYINNRKFNNQTLSVSATEIGSGYFWITQLMKEEELQFIYKYDKKNKTLVAVDKETVLPQLSPRDFFYGNASSSELEHVKLIFSLHEIGHLSVGPYVRYDSEFKSSLSDKMKYPSLDFYWKGGKFERVEQIPIKNPEAFLKWCQVALDFSEEDSKKLLHGEFVTLPQQKSTDTIVRVSVFKLTDDIISISNMFHINSIDYKNVEIDWTELPAKNGKSYFIGVLRNFSPNKNLFEIFQFEGDELKKVKSSELIPEITLDYFWNKNNIPKSDRKLMEENYTIHTGLDGSKSGSMGLIRTLSARDYEVETEEWDCYLVSYRWDGTRFVETECLGTGEEFFEVEGNLEEWSFVYKGLKKQINILFSISSHGDLAGTIHIDEYGMEHKWIYFYGYKEGSKIIPTSFSEPLQDEDWLENEWLLQNDDLLVKFELLLDAKTNKKETREITFQKDEFDDES